MRLTAGGQGSGEAGGSGRMDGFAALSIKEPRPAIWSTNRIQAEDRD
jgi:hypothetical protein